MISTALPSFPISPESAQTWGPALGLRWGGLWGLNTGRSGGEMGARSGRTREPSTGAAKWDVQDGTCPCGGDSPSSTDNDHAHPLAQPTSKLLSILNGSSDPKAPPTTMPCLHMTTPTSTVWSHPSVLLGKHPPLAVRGEKDLTSPPPRALCEGPAGKSLKS